jgi:two-component system response regulator NreC
MPLQFVNTIVVDDHKIFAASLAELLGRDHRVRVTGQFSSGLETIEFAMQYPIDLAIIDISIPDLNGIDTTRRLKKIIPELKVIILTMHDNFELLKKSKDAGANAYLLKECMPCELYLAISEISNGKNYFPALAKQKEPPPATYSSKLSVREKQVLEMVSNGYTSAQIAERLNLSKKTVETYRYRFSQKLGFKNISDLVKFSIRNKITST